MIFFKMMFLVFLLILQVAKYAFVFFFPLWVLGKIYDYIREKFFLRTHCYGSGIQEPNPIIRNEKRERERVASRPPAKHGCAEFRFAVVQNGRVNLVDDRGIYKLALPVTDAVSATVNGNRVLVSMRGGHARTYDAMSGALINAIR